MNNSYFERDFHALMGCAPFGWQRRFHRYLVENDVRSCDIPTGLGKTAVIAIWLIALAKFPAHVPRRLIYIVNRRTVVDQATDIVRDLRRRLDLPDDLPGETLQRLRSLRQELKRHAAYASREVVAISTLRGELADNEEWKKDPARPAIIIGTIDMIGSKLLFSGYGDRRYGRAHHAGLIGHDALIVHDEAHLTPAFGDLLRAVEHQQKREKSRAIRVMELSATGRSQNEKPVTLEVEDEIGDSVPAKTLRTRLDAEKCLALHPTDPKTIIEKIIELVANYEAARSKVLIYVTKPEDAKTVADRLRKQYDERVSLLTGTLRGYERDKLVETRVFRALLNSQQAVTETHYLVSTSAGEVGVDLDADHMVCDFTTLDSMIQRLGRVNRRGGRTARVDVVMAVDVEKGDTDGGRAAALAATRANLERLPRNADGSFNASPRSVNELLKSLSEEEKHAAFQHHPPAIPATDILFDAWSLTSIHDKLPGRPEVAAFLHGITNDPPETYVAWRHEVTLLSAPSVNITAVRDWFRACRPKSHELLRDNTDRVFQHLAKIRDRVPNTPIILLNERGEVERLSLDALPRKKEEARPVLAFRTVVLPVEAGGLSESGILDGGERKQASDVAEQQRRDPQQPERKRTRVHLRVMDGEFWTRTLDETEDFPDPATELGRECKSPRDAAAKIARERRMKISRMVPLREPIDGAEDEASEYLVFLIDRADIEVGDSENAPSDDPPTIAEHTTDVVERATRIANALSLDDSLKQALILAADLHDLGKGRDIWQRAIYNFPVNGQPLAKPKAEGMDWRRLAGYRHEFGSLLDASQHERVKNLSDEDRDLTFHLIAAHHGHARPHFEPETHNFEKNSSAENEATARETMRRFGRLQLRFGRWQLAWLESLLRCADAAASAEPTPRTGAAS